MKIISIQEISRKMKMPPWAKITEHGRLSVADHGRDVAAVFSALRAAPVFASRLEVAAGRALGETDRARLDVLAYLHDFGKCNGGFQRRADPAAQRVGHCEQAVPALQPEIAAQAPEVDAFWEEVEAKWHGGELLAAMLAHHGRPLRGLHADPDDAALNQAQLARVRSDAAYWRSGPDGAPLSDLLSLMAQARARWPAAFAGGASPLPADRPPFVALFAGLLTLADWIGSDETLFPVPRPHGWDAPEQIAARSVEARGLSRFDARAPDTFADVFGFAPWPAQIDAAADDLGAIAVLEAETGSGKTEAALWRFARLHAAGKVDALYFALPTRGAATQVFERLKRDLVAMFGDGAPSPVLAVPGYIRAGDADGRPTGPFQVTWDDETRDPARWAAEAPRRFLTARVAVGTVDQALMAALQVRHAHLRGAALSRSLLVVDEVHASDAYMTELLTHLLDNHKAMGGHALLLSATLGAGARSLLTKRALPSLAQAQAAPYPAVSGDAADPRQTRGGEGRKILLRCLPIQSDPAAIAARAIEAATQGASVLILRNTVGDVRETQAALEAAAPPGLLFTLAGVATVHHGRFAPEDRRALDARVEEIFGKTAAGRAPLVLVGSQTLEMSLDIDADLLLTDLAPMDVLLQRIGRLHRHSGRMRPRGFEAPRVLVMTPADRDLRRFERSMRHGLGPTKEGTGVYRDLGVIEATWAQLEGDVVLRVPQDCRALVERATHPEAVEAAATRAGLSRAPITGAENGEIQEARRAALDSVIRPFTSLLFPDEEKLSTRLGLQDLRIPLSPPRLGPFGAKISALTVPGHMARGIDPEAEAEVTPHGDVLRVALAGKAFVYGRLGLETNGAGS
jgi:CRISPR-associated endonuclease/helicase Cas3